MNGAFTGSTALKKLLDEKAAWYNRPSFIEKDPISIPHQYTLKQDQEIAGFFAAVLAWGNRTAIINSCTRLMQLMDRRPYDFILHHTPGELKPFLSFVHRTFNATDLLYFISFLQYHYRHYPTLEDAFVPETTYEGHDTGPALTYFNKYFFSLEHPARTQKHISSPAKKSACKRLNMFLRWMVRKDKQGVDFGIWTKIKPAQLVCPLDVHVARVAQRLQLLDNSRSDWNNALMLTTHLRAFDPADPVRYDYALFGLGTEERF